MSIRVRIRKQFDGFALDAAFEAGDETVALLGASGCGKSMTLRCIAGVTRPDEGEIAVDGETLFDSARGIDLPPQRRRVGLLFQSCALFPNMTVEENVRAVLALRGRGGDDARFRELREKFYIGGLENHYPAQLSGGQRQRAALARMMAGEPRIVMLDEPLSALDSYLRWQLEEELARALEAFPGTALYVSHNRDEVYRLCGKVCVMSEGRTEPVRSVKALFESPGTLASSLLSGCKNHSRALRLGGRAIRALDWGVDLLCAADAPEEARYVGVRARRVEPCGDGESENAFACRVLRVTQDAFGTTATLRPEAAEPDRDFSRIRMETPEREAAALKAGDLVRVRVRPADIMPLRE